MGKHVVFDIIGKCCTAAKYEVAYKWAKVIVAKPNLWFCQCKKPKLVVRRRLVETQTLIGIRGRNNDP